jgi:FtsP/CotA-like multicopper oxidase with cupredoxin domain
MRGVINNRVFEMNRVADDEVVQLGTREVWEFINRGGMPALPHPMHVHGLQFRVLGRLGSRYDGYLDEGWKDTVLLMPGERVRLMMRFEDYDGLFLYHCHNLEHEDMGMMRNYYVRAA